VDDSDDVAVRRDAVLKGAGLSVLAGLLGTALAEGVPIAAEADNRTSVFHLLYYDTETRLAAGIVKDNNPLVAIEATALIIYAPDKPGIPPVEDFNVPTGYEILNNQVYEVKNGTKPLWGHGYDEVDCKHDHHKVAGSIWVALCVTSPNASPSPKAR
jgi:hypothetical protein